MTIHSITNPASPEPSTQLSGRQTLQMQEDPTVKSQVSLHFGTEHSWNEMDWLYPGRDGVTWLPKVEIAF